MGNTSPEFDAIINRIKEDNERRRIEPEVITELSHAAILRLAIQSAEEAAS
jgi:hypothetical protein